MKNDTVIEEVLRELRRQGRVLGSIETRLKVVEADAKIIRQGLVGSGQRLTALEQLIERGGAPVFAGCKRGGGIAQRIGQRRERKTLCCTLSEALTADYPSARTHDGQASVRALTLERDRVNGSVEHCDESFDVVSLAGNSCGEWWDS